MAPRKSKAKQEAVASAPAVAAPASFADNLPDFLKQSAGFLTQQPVVTQQELAALSDTQEQVKSSAGDVIEAVAGVTTLKVKKLRPDAVIPTLATSGSACFDLFAVDAYNEAVVPDRPLVVRTGLAFEIPEGYALMIYSRSGHGFKFNTRLSNSVGIIDSDYRGEVMVSLTRDRSQNDAYNFSMLKINSGDRIAQAMLVKCPTVAFEIVTELSETQRGEGGFGSTGA